MATARRLSPLAKELLAIVNENGFAYTDRFDYRAPGYAEKVKRAADQLLSRGLVQVGMGVPRRGVWVVAKRPTVS